MSKLESARRQMKIDVHSDCFWAHIDFSDKMFLEIDALCDKKKIRFADFVALSIWNALHSVKEDDDFDIKEEGFCDLIEPTGGLYES